MIASTPWKLCRRNIFGTGFARQWLIVSKRGMTTEESRDLGAVSQALLPDLHHNESLFQYTRGRFIRDEKNQLSQRQVRFNVKELARCAAEAIGATSCISVEKYPDGMYNKCMLLSMDNGAQVVAKVPNPNAGLAHFTTASEVATMDFTRTVLGTPIPKVLAWSSKAEDNPVGAEYIIMEKAPGIELERVWPSMEIKDRFAIIKTIAGFQKAWTSISFKNFGSLYYADDLDETVQNEPLYIDAMANRITDRRFAVGPSTGRETIDDGRANIGFNRGPWNSLEEYHVAIGYREMACISQQPHLPQSPITLCGPGTYKPTRMKKLKALDYYLTLIKVLLPTDQVISTAHLWHGDLHVANIFVDPSEPTKITSLIDWQSTELSPLYFQARQPHLIDYDGPPIIGLERPVLPKDFAKLEAATKQREETLYLQQSLCSLYNTLTHHQNPKVYAAFEFQRTTSYDLLLLARNLLIDGEITYLKQVMDLEITWDRFPGARGIAYPFKFSAEEREAIEADLDGVVRGMEAMRSIGESLGDLFPEQGIVRPDQYEEALDALEQMKKQVIDTFARTAEEREIWQKVWPFGT